MEHYRKTNSNLIVKALVVGQFKYNEPVNADEIKSFIRQNTKVREIHCTISSASFQIQTKKSLYVIEKENVLVTTEDDNIRMYTKKMFREMFKKVSKKNRYEMIQC